MPDCQARGEPLDITELYTEFISGRWRLQVVDTHGHTEKALRPYRFLEARLPTPPLADCPLGQRRKYHLAAP